tara:strand:- start:7684 stop:13224 length:5541 start_codon:yes stop_codon:yes gene_type:complete
MSDYSISKQELFKRYLEEVPFSAGRVRDYPSRAYADAIQRLKLDPSTVEPDQEGLSLYRKRQEVKKSFVPSIGSGEEDHSKKLSTLEESFDWFIDENSAPMWKKAYMQSITGASEQFATGKPRYSPEEYENTTWWEDMLAPVIGMAMPGDIATMFAGGKFWQWGAKLTKPVWGPVASRFAPGLTKAANEWLVRGVQTRAGQVAQRTGLIQTAESWGKTKATEYVFNPIATSTAKGAAHGFANLSFFGGTHAFFDGHNKGKRGSDLTNYVAKSAFESGLIGALAGGVGTGMAAKRSELLLNEELKGNVLKGLLYSQGGMAGAEIAALSVPQALHMAVSGVASEEGISKPAEFEDYMQMVGTNAAMVFGMKAWGNTYGKILKPSIDVLKVEAKDALINMGLKTDITSKEVKVVEETLGNLARDPDVSREAIDVIKSSLEKLNKKQVKDVGGVNEALAILQEAASKKLDTKNFKETWPKVYEALMVSLTASKKLQKSKDPREAELGISVEKRIVEGLDKLNASVGARGGTRYTDKIVKEKAKQYNIDISKMGIEEARKVVKAKDEAYQGRDVSEISKEVEAKNLRDLDRQGVQDIVKDPNLTEQNKDQLVYTVSQKLPDNARTKPIVNTITEYAKFIQNKGGELLSNFVNHKQWVKDFLAEKVKGFDPNKSIAENKKTMSVSKMKQVDGLINKLDNVFSQTTREVGGNPMVDIPRFNVPSTVQAKGPIATPELIKGAMSSIKFLGQKFYTMPGALSSKLKQLIEKPKAVSFNEKTRKGLIQYAKAIEKQAGFKKNKNMNEKMDIIGRESLKNAHEVDVLRWIDYIKTKQVFNVKKGLETSFFKSKELLHTSPDGIRILSKVEEKTLASLLGAKDGKIENFTTKEQFDLFDLHMHSIGQKKFPNENLYIDAVNEANIQPELLKKVYGKSLKWRVGNSDSMIMYMMGKTFGKKGQKAFSKIFNTLSRIQSHYEAQRRIRYESPMKGAIEVMSKALGDDAAIIKYIVSKSARKNVLRNKELAEKVLSKEHIKLLEKIEKNGLTGREKWVADYHKQFTDGVWEMYKRNLKSSVTKQQFEKATKEIFDRYLKDYTTNVFTNEAREILFSNQETGIFNKYFKKNYKVWAKGYAKKELGIDPTKNPNKFKKAVQELMDNPLLHNGWLSKVKTEVFLQLKNNDKHHKLRNRYLLERLPEFEAFFKHDGKIIQTYESSIDGYLARYADAAAKNLAALEVLPEFTDIGVKYGAKRHTHKILNIMKEYKPMGEWINKSFERLLQVRPEQGGKLIAAGGYFSQIGVMTGLSSPYYTQAVKNVVMGLPQVWGHNGTLATLRAITRSMNPALWKEAKEHGVLDMWSKEYMDRHTRLENLGTYTSKFMSLNGMKSTENWMRVVAFDAARFNYSTLEALLRNENPGWLRGTGRKLLMNTKLRDRIKKQIREELENKYMLSEKDIKLIEKGDLTSNNNLARYETILNKVDNYGHQTALGGTGLVMLPSWMSHKAASPALVFQKLAASKTQDFYRNFVKPMVKYQNPYPMLLAATGTMLGGKALVDYYQAMMHMGNPYDYDKDGKAWKKSMFYLHKGEFFQLFGHMFDPYTTIYGTEQERSLGGRAADFVIGNYTARFASEMWTNTMQIKSPEMFEDFKSKLGLSKGYKTWQDAADDFATRVVTGYGHIRKVSRKEASEFYRKNSQFNTYAAEWASENVKEGADISSYGREHMLPYNKYLRDAFFFGTEDEIVKSTWGIVNALYSSALSAPNGHNRHDFLKHRKDIFRSIKASIDNYNPISYLSKVEKAAFMRTLKPEVKKELDALLKQHEFRKAFFTRAMNTFKHEQKYAPWYHGSESPRPPKLKF